jgi:hypothetical protein
MARTPKVHRLNEAFTAMVTPAVINHVGGTTHAATISSITSLGPCTAASAPRCAKGTPHDTKASCSFCATEATRGVERIHPTRHPVIENDFDTPLTSNPSGACFLAPRDTLRARTASQQLITARKAAPSRGKFDLCTNVIQTHSIVNASPAPARTYRGAWCEVDVTVNLVTEDPQVPLACKPK